LLHDLGKYSREFQRKLAGESLRVDHSTAGARIAVQRYAQLGRLLAYIIAGHHAGLANGTGDANPRPLVMRLDPEKYRDVPVCPGWDADFTLPAELAWPRLAPHTNKAVRDTRTGHCLSLLTRMLLSALVDADRLDTEAFYAKTEGSGAAPRGDWQPLARLKERLDLHMAEVTKRVDCSAVNEGNRAVNAERAKVLAAARAKAELPPGLFSLTVPTGGGKTLASLTFALDHSVRHGLDRVIYVIPFTSIAEQTAAVFKNVMGPLADHIVEHHSGFREDEALAALERLAMDRGLEAESSLQSGERLRLATENWDAPIVVTTAVQFFESLFSNRPSKCRKLHNIARSVVILDEAQTLPLKLLRPCVAVLDELARNYRTTVVLCTATQPALAAKRDDGSEGLAGGLVDVTEIIDQPNELYQRLRRVKVEPCLKLTDDTLAEQMSQHDQVLCIVGTRAHARELFEKVKFKQPVGTFHLSALMCAAHRSRKLAEIKAALNNDGLCRVIATTVVEAGVDIDFPLVYRIMAGLDSVAQAAGRCNREGKRDREESIVQLFEIEGRRSIPELRASEDAAREVLRQPDVDALGLGAMDAYFRRVYWGRTQGRDDGLDTKDILGRLNTQAGEIWLPFVDIAQDFRMIDQAMEPVIVPWDDDADRLIKELETAKSPGAITRELQPYTVNVPRSPFVELQRVGRIVPVNEHRFQDQFMQLTKEARDELYKDDLGFDWSEATFRRIESNIF
jgi:CRISPR-associated endonuclease/helicase Cas3